MKSGRDIFSLMNYVMERAGKKFRGSVIVSKDPRSTASFTIESSVRDFLNNLCGVDANRNLVTPQIDAVVKFFKNNSTYKGVRQIRVDMNLIEVRRFRMIKSNDQKNLNFRGQNKFFGVKRTVFC